MARRKEFDVDAALDKAMALFWQQGYERTSLADLLEHMDIGRASFYNAFDDKHSLFMRILDRYQAQYNQVIIIDPLVNSDGGLDGIETVFRKVVDGLSNDPDKRGCLLVNSASEIAPNDAEVSAYITEIARDCEDAFYDALRQAQLAGNIGSTIDCRAMARFMMTTIRGMRVYGRMSNDRRVFEDIARIALSTLNV